MEKIPASDLRLVVHPIIYQGLFLTHPQDSSHQKQDFLIFLGFWGIYIYTYIYPLPKKNQPTFANLHVVASCRRSQDAEGVGQWKAAKVASPKEMRQASRMGKRKLHPSLVWFGWMWCFGGSVGFPLRGV